MDDKAIQVTGKRQVQAEAEPTRPGVLFMPAVDIFESENEITLLADLDAAQEATLDLLHSLEDETLAMTGTHPAWGEVSLRQVLRIIPLHDSMHRRDILKLRKAMEK